MSPATGMRLQTQSPRQGRWQGVDVPASWSPGKRGHAPRPGRSPEGWLESRSGVDGSRGRCAHGLAWMHGKSRAGRYASDRSREGCGREAKALRACLTSLRQLALDRSAGCSCRRPGVRTRTRRSAGAMTCSSSARSRFSRAGGSASGPAAAAGQVTRRPSGCQRELPRLAQAMPKATPSDGPFAWRVLREPSKIGGRGRNRRGRAWPRSRSSSTTRAA
jgi:hypothetical protein